MSTLLHVSNAELDAALAEIVRVLHPGAPLAIGLWGSDDGREELWDDGTDFGPPRFFSIRTDQALHEALRRHGSLVETARWPTERTLHHQWALVHTP